MRARSPRMLLALLLLVLAPQACDGAISVVGDLSQERDVEPGKTYRGVIAVRNLGRTAQTVKLYLRDYIFFADGSNLFEEPGKRPRSNAGWVTVSPTLLTIPPMEAATASYRIAVPNDKDLRGTYWCVAMVEGLGEPIAQSVASENGKVQVGIRQVIRYGVQLVTNVGVAGSPRLKFDAKLTRENGKRFLQIDVENTGERWLRPFVSAQLFDEAGRLLGKFDAQRARLFPGTSVRKTIDLSGVPPGNYRALLVADGGEDSVYGATYTLKLENEKAAE